MGYRTLELTGGGSDRLVGLACSILAAAIFVGLWSFLSPTWPVSSEEVSVYPARAGLVLAPVPPTNFGTLSFENGCHDVQGVAIRSSSVRPLVSLCWNGRRLPILLTSYASGIPYWISEIFRQQHRDNVFRLRVSGLLLGLLTLLSARRLVQIFAGPAQGNAAALCRPVIGHTHFAGTGTRYLNDQGKTAIEQLFSDSFGKS